MTTICITVPALKTITRGLSSDWGPTLHAAARRLGALVALIWTLCSMAADRWQQLMAWAQEHQLDGLARLGLPKGSCQGSLDSSTAEESSVAPAMIFGIDFAGPEGSATVHTIVQRQPGGNLKALLTGSAPDQFPGATEMVTTPANVAPLSIRHLAAQGLSQRKIAGTLGLTRYQVQKALAA